MFTGKLTDIFRALLKPLRLAHSGHREGMGGAKCHRWRSSNATLREMHSYNGRGRYLALFRWKQRSGHWYLINFVANRWSNIHLGTFRYVSKRRVAASRAGSRFEDAGTPTSAMWESKRCSSIRGSAGIHWDDGAFNRDMLQVLHTRAAC